MKYGEVVLERAGMKHWTDFELPESMARPTMVRKCPHDKKNERPLDSCRRRKRLKGRFRRSPRKLLPVRPGLQTLSRGQSHRPHSSGDPDLETSVVVHSVYQTAAILKLYKMRHLHEVLSGIWKCFFLISNSCESLNPKSCSLRNRHLGLGVPMTGQ